jgi:DNA primase
VDFARTLKDRIDIVQVISERVRLQKTGATFKARCPFHNEKTPSFNVNPSRQMFKCFGCGKGGTVLDFVMEMDGLSFWEACVQLAERYGIPLPQRDRLADPESRTRAGVYEAQEIAARLFQETLLGPTGLTARGYLERRGVKPSVAEQFGLGLSDRGGQTMVRALQQAGVPLEMMEQTGLVLKRETGGFYDRFRNRLMFPIHSETGKIIGFGGRAIEQGDEPKYLNSPETAIYRKSQVLYNLHRARKEIRQRDTAVLVEGYMDVIGLAAAGIENAVASCGTALTLQQARMIKRHSENVVVNFDPDRAGINATEKSIDIFLDEGMRIRVLTLDGGLDPDEYVAKHGPEGYRSALASSTRYFHWLGDQARKRYDMKSAEGRVEALRFLRPSLNRVPDRLERATVAQDIASFLGVEAKLVLEPLGKAPPPRGGETAMTGPKIADLPSTEVLLLRCLLNSSEARRELKASIEPLIQGNLLVLGRVIDAVLGADDPPDWPQVEQNLDSEGRLLLSRLLFADEHSQEEDAGVGFLQAEACIRKLGEISHERMVQTMKMRIREAEKEGRIEEVLRLTQELVSMGRRVVAARPGA